MIRVPYQTRVARQGDVTRPGRLPARQGDITDRQGGTVGRQGGMAGRQGGMVGRQGGIASGGEPDGIQPVPWRTQPASDADGLDLLRRIRDCIKRI